MSWTSYLPDSPERLSAIEGWLYFTIFLFGVLAAVSGYAVVHVRGHRAILEKNALENQLEKTRADLSATRLELDQARTYAEEARKEASQVRANSKPRDVPSEKREAILSSLRRAKGKVDILYLSDAEAAAFAGKLRKIIDEAGWQTNEQGVMGFGPIVGLIIQIHDEKTSPSYTRVLKEALDLAFEKVVVRTTPTVAEGRLILFVGSKPAE